MGVVISRAVGTDLTLSCSLSPSLSLLSPCQIISFNVHENSETTLTSTWSDNSINQLKGDVSDDRNSSLAGMGHADAAIGHGDAGIFDDSSMDCGTSYQNRSKTKSQESVVHQSGPDAFCSRLLPAYTWDIQPMYAYPGYRPTALCVFHQSRVPRRIQRFFSDSVAGHSRFLLGRSLSTGFDSYHLHRRMVRPKHSP